MRTKPQIAFPFLLILCFCISCQKEISWENLNTVVVNLSPIAQAGTDQTLTVPLDSTILNGSASTDPDGTIVAFQWTKISGPASFQIVTSTNVNSKVRNLVGGIYKFELKVTDDKGLTDTDTIQLKVLDPALNHPPVANAGADQTITMPLISVWLNGTTSTDPDDNIAGYEWSLVGGSSIHSITNATSAVALARFLGSGDYIFELKVTDSFGLFDTDSLNVKVKDP